MPSTGGAAPDSNAAPPSPAQAIRFSLGRVWATPGALAALAASAQSPTEFLARHQRGDWGDLPQADRAANDRALGEEAWLLSSYLTRQGARLWIITEADRSVTTLLLPTEP